MPKRRDLRDKKKEDGDSKWRTYLVVRLDGKDFDYKGKVEGRNPEEAVRRSKSDFNYGSGGFFVVTKKSFKKAEDYL